MLTTQRKRNVGQSSKLPQLLLSSYAVPGSLWQTRDETLYFQQKIFNPFHNLQLASQEGHLGAGTCLD